MSSSGKCFICKGNLSEGVTSEVKEKGGRTLIDYNSKWKDGKHSHLKGLRRVTVHEKCRKMYTKERNAEASQTRRQTSPGPTSSLLKQNGQATGTYTLKQFKRCYFILC